MEEGGGFHTSNPQPASFVARTLGTIVQLLAGFGGCIEQRIPSALSISRVAASAKRMTCMYVRIVKIFHHTETET